jgi:hypothetical protein
VVDDDESRSPRSTTFRSSAPWRSTSGPRSGSTDASRAEETSDGEHPSTATAGDGGDPFEPHVAVDPMDPRRVAVVAATHGGEDHFWCWSTEDGGASWSDGSVRQPQDDDGGAADPIVA